MTVLVHGSLHVRSSTRRPNLDRAVAVLVSAGQAFRAWSHPSPRRPVDRNGHAKRALPRWRAGWGREHRAPKCTNAGNCTVRNAHLQLALARWWYFASCVCLVICNRGQGHLASDVVNIVRASASGKRPWETGTLISARGCWRGCFCPTSWCENNLRLGPSCAPFPACIVIQADESKSRFVREHLLQSFRPRAETTHHRISIQERAHRLAITLSPARSHRQAARSQRRRVSPFHRYSTHSAPSIDRASLSNKQPATPPGVIVRWSSREAGRGRDLGFTAAGFLPVATTRRADPGGSFGAPVK